MSTAREAIEKLLDRGVSKYSIAKKLGVTWQTVNQWYRGKFSPRQTLAMKLEEMAK